MTGFVLVPLDGSEHALCALPVARVLAELERAPLRIVHVAEQTLPASVVLERLGLSADDLRGSVLDVRAGNPTDAILEAARDEACRHVVLCGYVGVAVPGKTVGRTALAVVRGARCPVTLVRPERGLAPWKLRKLVMPHDGTPTTTYPFRPAAELARKAGAELAVLHVTAPGVAAPREIGSLPTPRYVDQPAHEWPSWAREFLGRVGCLCPLEGLHVRMALASGAPASEIVRYAREQTIDLIVLAWRGDWETGHAMIMKEVLRDAPCPVMVLRVDI